MGSGINVPPDETAANETEVKADETEVKELQSMFSDRRRPITERSASAEDLRSSPLPLSKFNHWKVGEFNRYEAGLTKLELEDLRSKGARLAEERRRHAQMLNQEQHEQRESAHRSVKEQQRLKAEQAAKMKEELVAMRAYSDAEKAAHTSRARQRAKARLEQAERIRLSSGLATDRSAARVTKFRQERNDHLKELESIRQRNRDEKGATASRVRAETSLEVTDEAKHFYFKQRRESARAVRDAKQAWGAERRDSNRRYLEVASGRKLGVQETRNKARAEIETVVSRRRDVATQMRGTRISSVHSYESMKKALQENVRQSWETTYTSKFVSADEAGEYTRSPYKEENFK